MALVNTILELISIACSFAHRKWYARLRLTDSPRNGTGLKTCLTHILDQCKPEQPDDLPTNQPTCSQSMTGQLTYTGRLATTGMENSHGNLLIHVCGQTVTLEY